MRRVNALDWTAIILLVIGGINWGLVGLFNLDLVATIFGESVLSRVVYIIIGICAIYVLIISSKLDRE